MSKALAMDESGNTQKICAFCLVSIPQKELQRMGEILSVKDDDPEEIKTLYGKVCGGEFKYSNFRNAYKTTGLEVYDKYLKGKLHEISKLHIQIYYSVFPNPVDNKERLARLHDEASYLIHNWAHGNQADAFDHNLRITVDQQVFAEKKIFDYYLRRGKFYALLANKSAIGPALSDGRLKRVGADRSNKVEVEPVNSHSYKRIQLSDLIVGCIREHYVHNVDDNFAILHPLIHKQTARVQLENYVPPAMQRI